MKSLTLVRSVLAVSLVCLAGTVRADVVNGDFSAGVDGWQTQGKWTPDTTGGSPDGPSAKGTGYAWLYQPGLASPVIVEGQTYQLSFLGKLLADDGVASDSILNANFGVDGTTTATTILPTLTSSWQQYNITYTATAADVGHTWTVAFLNSYGRMTNMEGATGGSTFGIDSVRFGAVSTPEPSTLVLLGTALFGLLAYAWRKRK